MRRVNVGAVKPDRVPTIACINRATSGLGVDFPSLISALQKYVDKHLAPVWGTPAKLAWTYPRPMTSGKRKLRLRSSSGKARALRREDRDLHRSGFRGG